MATLTRRVETIARDNGADLVGFAPIERFDNAPPEYHPHTIFPQTRTAMVVAICQERGALKAVEEGCYWQSYNCDNYWYINEVMAPRLLRSIIMPLEAEGYTSVPVHNPFMHHAGKQIRDDQPHGPDGMVSLRTIGVAAGLGELGHSKVFLSPEFGPRQRLFAVLTDAELEPTPMFTGKVCDDCGACVRACQACAIGTERDIKVNIAGHEYAHAALDTKACHMVHWGKDPKYSPFISGDEPPGKMARYNEWTYHRFRNLGVCVGRGCLRACLDHLERTDRITTKFKTPLIERPQWNLPE